MTKAQLMLWCVELDRRILRARALVELGLPDPTFEFLEDEIFRFNQTCLAGVRQRRAAA